MKQMKFKCTLLSDIILSPTASSEGGADSLDFIPGNNFLGIVASHIYDEKDCDSLSIFHSGIVRFGDAHPSLEGKNRALKVPASMYHPKLKKANEECYIHYLIENHDDVDIRNLQLKQCREGFYSFNSKAGEPISTEKNFAIKSAYDSVNRRSKDQLMFGYESLAKGLVLFFEIESDLDESINDKIKDALIGIQHVGRSRTAQYGLVRIEETNYSEVNSSPQLQTLPDGKQYATVYADGRLIFFDENNEPTFQPSARDLGFAESDEIDWSKSQIRTFQYSPWNGKRHTYDTDRCGIEKGSVFVVACTSCPETSQYIGFYKNEGFGKVIYNPDFLQGHNGSKALYTLKEKADTLINQTTTTTVDTPFLSFLRKRKEALDADNKAYEIANKFVNEHASLFRGEQFASQWGSIRSIAMVSTTAEDLIENVKNFLNHGVAEEKWNERNRANILLDFMREHTRENLQDIIINLASEMAKRSRKEKK